MLNSKIRIATTALFALTLAACGSKTPSIDQVKADFESPSGSTKSKQSVAGAYAKQNSSGPATSFAAGGFAGGGFGLTQAGPGAFTRQNVVNPLLSYIRARALGVKYQGLSEAQDSSCFDQSNVSGSGSADGTSGSVSYSVDLGACSGGALTGQLTVDAEFELDQAAGILHYEVEQTMDQVCSTEPASCVDGTMTMEMDLNFNDLTGQGASNLVAGWFFTITEDGKTYETKGGMRLDADSASGATKFEYLVYVKDENGQEVSLVISFEDDGMGNSSLKITGSDGSISCTANADGSGSCDGDLSWDGAFIEELEADEDFTSY